MQGTREGSSAPFAIRRRVKWGDCDPAGVVYTPRFSDYVVEAFLEFSAHLIGSPPQEKLRELDLDLPAKAISLVFKQSLWPDEIFDMSVEVAAIRRRTFDLSIVGVTTEGGECFAATLSPICVRPVSRESCPIPESLRTKLESHRRAMPPRAARASSDEGSSDMIASAPTRYVVLHHPGPAWVQALPVVAQPGLAEHLSYLKAAHEAGWIESAGPFLVEGVGGMVITSKQCTEASAVRLAEDDPGVKSGLIRAEVRPWLTTLR